MYRMIAAVLMVAWVGGCRSEGQTASNGLVAYDAQRSMVVEDMTRGSAIANPTVTAWIVQEVRDPNEFSGVKVTAVHHVKYELDLDSLVATVTSEQKYASFEEAGLGDNLETIPSFFWRWPFAGVAGPVFDVLFSPPERVVPDGGVSLTNSDYSVLLGDDPLYDTTGVLVLDPAFRERAAAFVFRGRYYNHVSLPLAIVDCSSGSCVTYAFSLRGLDKADCSGSYGEPAVGQRIRGARISGLIYPLAGCVVPGAQECEGHERKPISEFDSWGPCDFSALFKVEGYCEMYAGPGCALGAQPGCSDELEGVPTCAISM